MIDIPTLNGSHLQVETVQKEIPEAVLRKLNHAEWLGDFSKVLGLQGPGSPPLTPMRQGAIQRLHLAAEYVRLLERLLGEAEGSIETLKKELAYERAGDAEGR